jgi:poly-gamma-glutamate capsule biosynthesis protein CapA/YwtB (metallophosphatase superfamily)
MPARSTLSGAMLLSLTACSAPASAVQPPPRVAPQVPAPTPAPATTTIKPVPSDIPPAPAPAPSKGPLELAFVGDIILGKYKLREYAPLFAPGEDPFAGVAELLKVDVAIANLETPLMHTRPDKSPIYIGSRFGADKAAARALVGTFAAVSVANNHALDLLTPGLKETPEVLRELGIAAPGAAKAAGDPVVIVTLEKAGWRLALLSATTWTNRPPAPGDPALPVYRTSEMRRKLQPAITAARADHDLVIVLLHWGQEYTDGPDHAMRTTAQKLLEGGADLVVGHHPHVLHGVEHHAQGLAAYSMGNFLFANTDERSRLSGVLRVRYQPGQRCPERASFHPVWLGEGPGYRPAAATGDEAKQIRDRVASLSKKLKTPLVADGEALVVETWRCDQAAPTAAAK